MKNDPTKLQAELDRIRSWRKVELSQARSLAERHRSSAELPYLCRVWTMMIYAHCDQALKLAAKEYLNFLMDSPRSGYDYRTVWLSFYGKDALRNISDSRFNLCKSTDESSYNVMLKNVNGKEVFGSANFSYPLLRFFMDWIVQTPFDHGAYKAFCLTLKEKRDAIAHGEEIILRDIEDCLAWHEPAVSLLDGIVDATLDAALKH